MEFESKLARQYYEEISEKIDDQLELIDSKIDEWGQGMSQAEVASITFAIIKERCAQFRAVAKEASELELQSKSVEAAQAAALTAVCNGQVDG
jgi:hypothetical protein